MNTEQSTLVTSLLNQGYIISIRTHALDKTPINFELSPLPLSPQNKGMVQVKETKMRVATSTISHQDVYILLAIGYKRLFSIFGKSLIIYLPPELIALPSDKSVALYNLTEDPSLLHLPALGSFVYLISPPSVHIITWVGKWAELSHQIGGREDIVLVTDELSDIDPLFMINVNGVNLVLPLYLSHKYGAFIVSTI